jgi:hypothetical protein
MFGYLLFNTKYQIMLSYLNIKNEKTNYLSVILIKFKQNDIYADLYLLKKHKDRQKHLSICFCRSSWISKGFHLFLKDGIPNH